MSHPVIENAPGLTWKPRKAGMECRWHARTDLIRRGYLPKSVRLWCGTELTDLDRAYISDRANALQSDMLVWGRGGLPVVSGFDGTLKSLIRCYQTDADSTYRKLRYRTRLNYDWMCKLLYSDHGDEPLAEIKARHLLRWHEEWSEGGKITKAHGLVGMLRTLVNFGATILESEQCERIALALHKMRFKMGKPRTERITAEQATAVRAMAHTMKHPAIALAQAFQFEVMLRQKDVIGEWVPMSEPGLSLVTEGNDKWLRGLRWEEIDANLILRHVTSKKNKDIEFDLKLAPMVMEELARLGERPTSGPVIVSGATGLPYRGGVFGKKWREIATKAGIPPEVKNMDSRAGGITEATEAGADIEHVKHAATHSNIATTQNYSRGATDKVAGVMRTRVAHRNKSGTDNA